MQPAAQTKFFSRTILQLLDYDPLRHNVALGHAVLGMLGGDTGAKHWKEVLSHPEQSLTIWHKLAAR